MREREKFYANEQRNRIFGEAHYQCEYPGCTRPATELAHKIAKSGANIAMLARVWERDMEWAKTIIHSRENLAASCRMHNDYFNVGNDMEEIELIVRNHDNRERSKQGDTGVPETKRLVRRT